ncbi:MAG: hypothetical protein V1776_01740 [Candidatus Diapherotrites archaeon]
MKRLLFILLFAIFLSPFSSAQMVGFPNGSFETGDLTDWNYFTPSSGVGYSPCSSGTMTLPSSVSVSTDWASSGVYGLRTIAAVPTVQNNCHILQNTSNPTFSGKKTFYADLNVITGYSNGTAQWKFVFDHNSNIQLGSGCSDSFLQVGRNDLNCTTPDSLINNPDYSVQLFFTCGSSFGGCSGKQFIFDNFRYENVNETCTNVVFKGSSSDKIDVVFVGSGFSNLSQFGNVVDDMIDKDGTGTGIMSYTPFKNYKDNFNFWKVNTLQTFGGGVSLVNGNWVYDDTYETQARDLVKSSCGEVNEFIPQFVSLMVTPRVHSHAKAYDQIRLGLGEAYVTVGQEYITDSNWPLDLHFLGDLNQVLFYGSSKTDVRKTLVHEFGHSFGGLSDEYDARSAVQKANNIDLNGGDSLFRANCDSSIICSKWSDFTGIDCNAICGFTNWRRPYNQSVMFNAYLPGVIYGEVSEKELESDINGFFGLLFSQTENLFSYSLNVHYSGGSVYLNEVDLVYQTAQPSLFQPSSGNQLKIIARDEEVLYDLNFLFPIQSLLTPSSGWFDANGDQIDGGGVEAILMDNDLNYSFTLPHFSNASRIDIFDSNANLKLSVDVSNFSDKISYSLGYGSGEISDSNYTVRYETNGQPVAKGLTSTSYVCSLGTIFN